LEVSAGGGVIAATAFASSGEMKIGVLGAFVGVAA